MKNWTPFSNGRSFTAPAKPGSFSILPPRVKGGTRLNSSTRDCCRRSMKRRASASSIAVNWTKSSAKCPALLARVRVCAMTRPPVGFKK